MTEYILEGDQLAKESAPGALGCLRLLPAGFHLGSSGGGRSAWHEPDHQLRSGGETAPLCYLQPCLSKGIWCPDCHSVAVCFPITGMVLSI